MGIQSGQIRLGRIKKGDKNLITDVPGVTVGHTTLSSRLCRTGVTAVLPHGGNLFQNKVKAASYVINGFGKSMGLVQVDELGTIETPLLLTNTLSVGTAATALTKYMLEQNPDIGTRTGTVNCLVTECNDGVLNDIRGLHVTEEHVLGALHRAGPEFEEGSVGAGTGMVCQGLKGGIGSASRLLRLDDTEYTVGALVMSNFGFPGELLIDGMRVGRDLLPQIEARQAALAQPQAPLPEKDLGSIIIILATDLPMNERQLKRAAKRSVVGLARTGSCLGNGSGDICVAFTTANQVPHYSEKKILPAAMLHDDCMDDVFRAAAEAVEEAIISSLYHAETTVGCDGTTVFSLRDFL